MQRTLRAAAAAAALCATPAAANEFILGFGAQDLVGRGTAPTLSLDFRSDPVGRVGPAPVRLGAGAEVDTRGDAWAGGGVVAAVPLATGLRLEASVMPGAATRRPGEERRATATLRSRLGLGLDLPGPWSADLTFTTRSNGGTRGGPGVAVAFGRSF
jgi:hypothetical protein